MPLMFAFVIWTFTIYLPRCIWRERLFPWDPDSIEGYFWRKMAVFGPKLRRFGRAPPDLAPTPRVATGDFLAQNFDLAYIYIYVGNCPLAASRPRPGC